MTGLLLLALQALLFFAVMGMLFRLRGTLGIGVFVCALGVLHFLETYLAAVFFIQLPFGLISPGSTVMFAGKLSMILMLYIREDAETVRQPIYGLLIGNCLMVPLAAILRLYDPMPLPTGHIADLTLIDQLGMLMVWGTVVLFADSIALVLLYERLRKWIPHSLFLRASISLAVILTFDQFAFFAGLHLATGTPFAALLGGWVAKLGASVLYAALATFYLRHFESGEEHGLPGNQKLTDIFNKLTYRHRYEALLEQSGIDALTGVLDRNRFEALAQSSLTRARKQRRPLSLAIIDVDYFKQINDRYGHVTGDDVLRKIAQALRDSMRSDDKIFRYGGEEFVVLCEGMNHEAAMAHAERMRAAVPNALRGSLAITPTVSIGVATAPSDGADVTELVRHADLHLYQAKHGGRNRVVGNHPADRRRGD
ncbi:MAG: GGDEF domain-containing protein [Sphingobium sp.]